MTVPLLRRIRGPTRTQVGNWAAIGRILSSTAPTGGKSVEAGGKSPTPPRPPAPHRPPPPPPPAPPRPASRRETHRTPPRSPLPRPHLPTNPHTSTPPLLP